MVWYAKKGESSQMGNGKMGCGKCLKCKNLLCENQNNMNSTVT